MRSFTFVCLGISAAGTLSAAPIQVPDLSPGDLLVTEYLANPAGVADSAGEYFEILNRRADAVDLSGLVVRDDGSNRFTVEPLVIGSGGFAVFANGDGSELGIAPDSVYGGAMSLTNGADEIVLERADGTVLHRVAWSDGDFFGAGVAHELADAGPGAPLQALGPTLGGDFVAADAVLTLENIGSPGTAGNTAGATTVVPLPGAAWLFGGALALLCRRRRPAEGPSGSRARLSRLSATPENRHAHAPSPA